ncbi:hypothetical protein V2J09_008081 [Rumex salicifolius]
MVVEERDQLSTQEEQVNNAHDEHVATSLNGPLTDKSTSIIKGKRTKRQRPQSPISFCLNLNADDNNDNDNKPESEESRSDLCIKIQEMNTTNTNTSILLSDDSHAYKTKEEEELEEYDIANCLILLAQGLPRYLCETLNKDDHYYKQPAVDQKKFTSKKFMETPYGDKAGYYVYECKTCFKTFPSFQALGGHRASHMKPKKDEERSNNLILNDAQCLNAYNVDNQYNHNFNNNIIQANVYSSTSNSNNNKKARIHECSTCGAEFLSGQALGGHMRRHRAPLGARIDNNINKGSRHNHNENYYSPPELQPSFSFKTSMVVNAENMVDNGGKAPLVLEAKKLFLNLDLNLAAPQEDESSKIHNASK